MLSLYSGSVEVRLRFAEVQSGEDEIKSLNKKEDADL